MNLHQYRYASLAPVGKHKLYIFEDFLDNIKKLIPKPEKVFIAVDYEVFEEVLHIINKKNFDIELKIFKIKHKDPPSSLSRISKARERLRKEALKTNYEWFL